MDDSAFNLKAQDMLLEKVNIACETAISGAVAIEKVRSRKENGQFYKIVLMDIEMPEMNGFQAAREIRKLVREEDTTIIGCTGYADHANDKAKTCMEEIVGKPITKSVLRKLLKKLDRKELD